MIPNGPGRPPRRRPEPLLEKVVMLLTTHWRRQDNVQFGLRAIDMAGHRIPAAFPQVAA